MKNQALKNPDIKSPAAKNQAFKIYSSPAGRAKKRQAGKKQSRHLKISPAAKPTSQQEWEEHLSVQRNVSNFVDHKLILIDNDYLRAKTVLDLGCGYGHQTEDLANHSPNKTFLGVDIDKKAVAQAVQNKTAGTNYKVSDINQKKKLGRFDSIITKLVLQHLPNLENYLKFCSKNLKKGGCVFIIDTYDSLRRISNGLADDLKHIYRQLEQAQKNKGSHRHALLKLPDLLSKNGFALEQEMVIAGITDREIKKTDLARLYQLNLSIIYNQYKVKFDLKGIHKKLNRWLKDPQSYGTISCHFLKIRKKDS